LNQWQHIALVRSGNSHTVYKNGVAGTPYTYTSTHAVGGGLSLMSGSYAGGQEVRGYVSNFRMVKGTAVYTSSFTPPTAPVTEITNTGLLANFTNAGIIDNTMINNLETAGDAKISTTQSKFGGGSMYFDGSGDYLTSIATPNIELGIGNYTIECWVNISAAASSGGIISKGPVGTLTNTTWSLEFNGSGNNVGYYVYNANSASFIITSTSNIKTSTWIHLAVCRSGNNTRLFVNGTQEGSTYTSGYTIATGDNLYIGGGFYAPTTRSITGYIDDLRITKGIARYTANFTPPATALQTL
jgi:hypothetical protein